MGESDLLSTLSRLPAEEASAEATAYSTDVNEQQQELILPKHTPQE